MNQNNYLQVCNGFGLIKSKNSTESLRVSSETVELLITCNGRQSLSEIISYRSNSASRGSDEALCEAIITLNKLIYQGTLVVEDSPAEYAVSIINKEKFRYPEAMHVELTTVCNLHCFFCYRRCGPGNFDERLPAAKLMEILYQLSKRGLQAVELTGGEPLMYPEFDKIIEFCGNTFPITSILTNATLINASTIARLKSLKDNIAFGISLESHRKEEHERRVGVKGSFEKTTEAIRNLAKNDFKIRVSMAVDKVNWDDVEPTLLLAQKLGATAFTYSAILPFGRAKNEANLWDLDIKDVWERELYLNSTYKEFIHSLDFNQKQQLAEPGSCGAGHRAYAMDPIGNVRLCVTFDSNMGVIGSLATQTIEEVFSHPLTKLSSEIEAPRPDICGSCKFTYFCHNCVLRGLTAYNSLGVSECAWVKNPVVNQWAGVILEHLGNSVP